MLGNPRFSLRQMTGTELKLSRQRKIAILCAILGLGWWAWPDSHPQQLTFHTYRQELEDDLLRLAVAEDKLVLWIFQTDYCFPCHQVFHHQLQNPEIKAAIEDLYVVVKVDVADTLSGGADLKERFQVQTLPTLVVSDNQARMVKKIARLGPPDYWQRELKVAAELRTIPALETRGQDSLPIYFRPDLNWAQSQRKDTPPASGEDPVFTLEVADAPNYHKARELARFQAHTWDQGVWIEPNPGKGKGYRVLLGAFPSKDEAKIVRAFLKTWDGVKHHIGSLTLTPLQYDP